MQNIMCRLKNTTESESGIRTVIGRGIHFEYFPQFLLVLLEHGSHGFCGESIAEQVRVCLARVRQDIQLEQFLQALRQRPGGGELVMCNPEGETIRKKSIQREEPTP